MSIDPADVVEAVGAIHRRIAAAGGSGVELVAVTKGFGPDAVAAAIAAGCRSIGENYAQELRAPAKAAAIGAARADGAGLHFIGQLQSNKVRLLADVVDVWETVDRPSLVDELARRAPGATVLVQVGPANAPGGGGGGKAGCPPEDVGVLVDACRRVGLDVDGLMTVGPTTGGPEAARPMFRTTRRLVDELGLRTCSMGMSDDLEVAIEAGSTRVRIGTALFGRRPRSV